MSLTDGLAEVMSPITLGSRSISTLEMVMILFCFSSFGIVTPVTEF